MINLLPPEEKRQLRAARSNTLLLRYTIFLLIAIAFLGAAIGVTYFYLSSTKASAEQTISDNKAKVSSYATIETQASQFRNNLATAKQILDHEVTYTKVILDISQLLPSGVVLPSLSLDSQTFGTETTIAASAKDYDRVLALKTAFENSPLFTNVHFISIANSASTAYPITVTLGVTIKKGAAQ
jgi:Tfp pilus assembly protein PilN